MLRALRWLGAVGWAMGLTAVSQDFCKKGFGPLGEAGVFTLGVEQIIAQSALLDFLFEHGLHRLG